MKEYPLKKVRKVLTKTITTLLLLALVAVASPEDEDGQILNEKAKKRLLEQEAATALIRLKRSIEKDGFYSGRIALNVWRNCAMDAGTFDQAQYDEFKKQLYEKSVNDSRRCFEEFLQEESFYDANICLQIWRLHSKELGIFDQEVYETLMARLTAAKTRNATKEKEQQEIVE
jgi:hypothetical protein